ncbi:MAG: hypothetical protein GKR90_18815 [Pseudomonadales bacterium]|nr:hypothetical protein [Pseudomonadales bacterium]
MLDQAQIRQYNEQGYLILKGAITDDEITRLERGVANNPPLDGTLDPNAPIYPAPGRYTLASQSARDPDLAFIIEHPDIVGAVREILEDDPVLTAYVIYDRTPEGAGLPPHHDYKRWRPVGSSMHWLFTIVPFCDFDEMTGPLYIAPGSHRTERVHDGETPCLEVGPAIRPKPEDFIDPGLKRGDLLLMNMHLWHRAEPNRSDKHRLGLFNKYAAASFPPATGYYLYHDDVAEALSEEGRKLIAVHSKRDITTTRSVLVREKEETEVFFLETTNGLYLPGGLTKDERAIPDWDLGNHIAPCQQHLREQVSIEVPWLSYIGDFEEEDGLCRTYGYTFNDNGFPVAYNGVWLSLSQISKEQLSLGWELEAVERWLDPKFIRGKGLSQAASRVDQFAY